MRKEGKFGKRNRFRKESFRRIFIRYFLWIGIGLSMLFCMAVCLGMELYARQYQLAQNKSLQKFQHSVSESVNASEDFFLQDDWIAELNANMIKEQNLTQITNFLYRMDNGKEVAATADQPYMAVSPYDESGTQYYMAADSYSGLIEEIEHNRKVYGQMNTEVIVEGIYVNENSFFLGNVVLNVRENGKICSRQEIGYTLDPRYLYTYSYLSAEEAHMEGPLYTNPQITTRNQNYLEQHYDVSNKISSGKLNEYDSVVDSHLFRDSYVITCSPINYSQNRETGFCMVSVYHYNLWQKCGLAITIAAIITFLLILLSTFFFSYRHYMQQKIQWEMISYRKNITNILAHDLRTPLTAISGYAENIINQSHPEKDTVYLQNIVDNVQYMNELIQHILLLSKEVDRRQPHTETVELADMTRELIKHYAEQAGEKNIHIYQDGSCSLSVNATWFHAVLKNLIGNAIGHGKEGSIISIFMDSTSYTITNSMPSGNGKEDKRRGMGMAIIKEILEYYGYQMQINEKDNRFMVSLLFTEQAEKNSSGKNMIIDEETKTIYADYKNLSKKELKIVERYVQKGYSLAGKDPEKVFIAPHNMGIHPKP